MVWLIRASVDTKRLKSCGRWLSIGLSRVQDLEFVARKEIVFFYFQQFTTSISSRVLRETIFSTPPGADGRAIQSINPTSLDAWSCARLDALIDSANLGRLV